MIYRVLLGSIVRAFALFPSIVVQMKLLIGPRPALDAQMPLAKIWTAKDLHKIAADAAISNVLSSLRAKTGGMRLEHQTWDGCRWRYLQCTGTFSVVLVALGIMCGELLLQSSLNIVQEERRNSNQSIWRPTVAPELRERCFVSLAQKLFATKACTINIISPYDC